MTKVYRPTVTVTLTRCFERNIERQMSVSITGSPLEVAALENAAAGLIMMAKAVQTEEGSRE